MSIATKVEGAGYRICETGSPTCTGLNPCFGCWVKINRTMLPSCVRQLITDEREVLRRLPHVMSEWQAAFIRLSDAEANQHAAAFSEMTEDAIEHAGAEVDRLRPDVRAQPYWVVLHIREILADRAARLAASPPPPPSPSPAPPASPDEEEVAAQVEAFKRAGQVVAPVAAPVAASSVASPVVPPIASPSPAVARKPQKGEVGQIIGEASERASASPEASPKGQVLGRVAIPRHVRDKMEREAREAAKIVVENGSSGALHEPDVAASSDDVKA